MRVTVSANRRSPSIPTMSAPLSLVVHQVLVAGRDGRQRRSRRPTSSARTNWRRRALALDPNDARPHNIKAMDPLLNQGRATTNPSRRANGRSP